MDPEAKAGVERLKNSLVDIRQKYAELSLRSADTISGGLTEGYRTVAQGLGLVLEELEADAETHQARLEVVLSGLETLADLMAERVLPDDFAADGGKETDDPSSRFREMFRTEARKRLSGLSISMMGIFSEQASKDALDQTGDHLHAMKGAASMVGLAEIAALVGAMEQIVIEMKRQEPQERTWPTRALMRGFHLLEEAAKDSALVLDEDRANDVIHTLRAYREKPAGSETARAEKTHSEQTSTEQTSSGQATSDKEADALPRDPQSTQPLEAAPRRAASDAANRFANYDGPLEKRILIVDDIEAIAASVGFVLSELDVPIDMAEHGEEALEMLKARPYSLVVSDVSMPRMDGVALTRMIRSDAYMSEIPVILLTSLDMPDERDRGIEAGATDYIIKGAIGGGELLNRVKELLELAPDVPAGDFPKNKDQYRILIAEDVETIAASIAFVLSEGPFEIEIARNGAKALARLQEEPYDLLLSDVEMPEMGGLELLGAVRSDEKLSRLPVILLTSLQDPKVQQQALDAGANRFLIKGEVAGATLRQIIEETTTSGGA